MGTMIALQALMIADVVGFEDGEREARQAAYVDLIGCKPPSGVSGVATGRRTCGGNTSDLVYCSVTIKDGIWTEMYLIRSTPPLVEGW